MDPISERIVDATEANITRAADLIARGKLVAFPTETVYGLGADATNDRAVANLFAAKNRPTFNPLIVHLAEPAEAETLVRFNRLAHTLAETFWPGALTIVLPRAADSTVSLLVSAGLDSLAMRVPDHAAALALLGRAGRPIAAPSANRAGAVSPTNADHVAISLGERVDMILDAGPCRIGLESTVIDLTGEKPVLLRPGGIAQEVIEAAIGTPLMPLTGVDASGPAKSPGLRGRHYAPTVPLRLDADAAEPGEALLAFGPDSPRRGALNLSRKGDLEEAAANLFAMMRLLDQSGVRGIAVMPIPERGLGRAINDRLRRAAAASGSG